MNFETFPMEIFQNLIFNIYNNNNKLEHFFKTHCISIEPLLSSGEKHISTVILGIEQSSVKSHRRLT